MIYLTLAVIAAIIIAAAVFFLWLDKTAPLRCEKCGSRERWRDRDDSRYTYWRCKKCGFVSRKEKVD